MTALGIAESRPPPPHQRYLGAPSRGWPRESPDVEGKKRNLDPLSLRQARRANGETALKEDSSQPAPEPPEWAKKRHDCRPWRGALALKRGVLQRGAPL